MNTYEKTYKRKNHFSFGRNWQDFLKTLNNEKIDEAKKSLVDFLGGEENIKGKTFVDIGCGSGLFSFAAYKLGASKVVSFDVDDFSIACVTYLREKGNNPANWEIKKGSALDKDLLNSLGKFDIVYSWGVLHHTGKMYQALRNTSNLLANKGIFYLAIYNNYKTSFHGGTSLFWLKIKRIYNHSGFVIKKIITFLYVSYYIIALLILFKNPVKYVRNYKSNRGMSWLYDVYDWLGGYPYEFAGPDEIINFFGPMGIVCKKLTFRDGLGCNEFLLIKQSEKN